MKLFQHILCAAAVLSFMGCQAPLYDAYKRQDVPALKRGLAAGEDPNATEPANWWWKVPTIPLALTVDIARTGLGIATLGLYPELEYLIRDSRTEWPFLTDYVGDYGSVSVAEAVEERCNLLYSPDTCRDSEVAIMVALLESGKVNSRALVDWCFIYSISKNDAALTRTCLYKGAGVNSVRNEKTPLMLAIEAGSGDVARVLMQYGANIHETTRSYSCQFVAQESGQLDLYRSLGGRMVDQPVAPRITCKACKGSGYEVCGRCGGDGKEWETNYNKITSEDIFGNEVILAKYEAGGRTVTCSSCSGSGRNKYSSCPQCNGVGSFSRYETIPQ